MTASLLGRHVLRLPLQPGSNQTETNHTEDINHIPIKQIHCCLNESTDCVFQCNTEEQLKKHTELEHSNKANIQCIECKSNFMNLDDLARHMSMNHRTGTDHSEDILKCDKCDYQSNQKNEIENHINQKHNITCYTCKEKFNIFSELITHRREMHPSNKKCRYFPECSWGEDCLYRHYENIEQENSQEVHAFTCKTCNNTLESKSSLMIHKKRTHSETVNICKDLDTNSCRRGAMHCWFHHDKNMFQPTAPRPTNESPVTNFTQSDFPQMPIRPQRTLMGNMSVELQQLKMIMQTQQQQQQQMAVMMTEIMKLRI